LGDGQLYEIYDPGDGEIHKRNVSERLFDMSQHTSFDTPVTFEDAESVSFVYPIFRAEDLSLELVRARVHNFDDSVGKLEPAISFGVLYDGIVVEVRSVGVTAEEIWEMFTGIG
jgi:hypothetical protein